jgi:hypothetical protein
MLKRQRASSPLAFPTEDVLSEVPMDFAPRIAKRRRVAAPVLDGALRAWRSPAPSDDDYDDGEYCSDERDGIGAGGHQDGQNTVQQAEAEREGALREYQATNALLHELHALHQQRLHTNAPSLPTPSSLHAPLLSMSHGTIYNQYLYQPQHTAFESWLGSSKLIPSGSNLGGNEPAPMHNSHTTSIEQLSTVNKSLGQDESERVRERYEGANKYISLLVHRFPENQLTDQPT